MATIQDNVNNYYFKTQADFEAHKAEIPNNSTIYIEETGEVNVEINGIETETIETLENIIVGDKTYKVSGGTNNVNNMNVTQEVLWTNPNPTQAFVAQSIDISNLSDYDYLVITSKMLLGGTGSKVYQNTSLINVKVGAGCTLESNLYDTNTRFRNVSINENNVIYFADTIIGHGEYTQTDNNQCIPLEIIGIKINPSDFTGWVDGQNAVITNTQVTTETNIDMSQFITNYNENGEYEVLLGYTVFNTSNTEFYLGSDKITLFKVAEAGGSNVSNYIRQTINIPFTKYLKYKLSSSGLNAFQVDLLGYRRIK